MTNLFVRASLFFGKYVHLTFAKLEFPKIVDICCTRQTRPHSPKGQWPF